MRKGPKVFLLSQFGKERLLLFFDRSISVELSKLLGYNRRLGAFVCYCGRIFKASAAVRRIRQKTHN